MKLNLKYINIILLVIIIILVVCMMIKKEHYKSNCNKKNNRPSHNLSKNNHNDNNNRLFAYTNNKGRNVYTNERSRYNYFKTMSSLCGTTHSINCEAPDNNKSDDYYNKKFIEIMSANSVEIENHMLNIKNNATKADKTIEEYETTPEGEKDILKLLCFLAGKSDCCKDKTDTYDKCVLKAENELQ